MISRIFFRANLLTTAMMITGPTFAQSLTATLEPAKPLYVQGEPVGLKLTIRNGTSEQAWLSLSYPSFEYTGSRAVKIDMTGTESEHLRPVGKSAVGGGLLQKIPRIPIGPGQDWSIDIYLQRLVGDVGPGTHVMTYSVSIPCQIRGHSVPAASGAGPSDNSLATGDGSFAVAVAAGGTAELETALAAYDKQRAGAEGDDFWKPVSAEEALCVAPTAAAIPYLAKVIKNGLSDCGVRALEKFRGNREAEALLAETARSDRTTKAAFAIELLGNWGTALSVDDLSQILNKNLSHLSVPALAYAAKIGLRDYLTVVSPRTNDADPATALAARRAEKLLSGATK